MTTDEFVVTGAPNAFPKGTPIGAKAKGRITNREKRQSTDIDGKALTWDNGQPRMEWVITLATADGDRRLFAKGNMLKAIKTAVVKAGQNSLDLGADLEVIRTGQDKPTRAGVDGAWTYDATYTPGAFGVDEDELI